MYFFQWKSGVFLSYSDVKFVLDGESLGQINTGEWLYFEVPAGKHEYVVVGGIHQFKGNFDFVEGHNNFFRGFINNGIDHVQLIQDEPSIREAIENIESGRYERGDID